MTTATATATATALTIVIGRETIAQAAIGCRARRYATAKKKPSVSYDSGILNSFKIWYREMSNYDDGDAFAQDQFLSYVLPYYRPKELVEDKDRAMRAFSVKTPLRKREEPDLSDSNQWYLNEIRVEKRETRGTSEKPAETKHLVMLHGYGASSGWFYKNYKGIIEGSKRVGNLSIHGLDMIGFGLSGRPNVRFAHDADTKPSLEIETQGIRWGRYAVCLKCGGHLDGKHNTGGHWCSCAAEEEDLRRGVAAGGGGPASVVVKKEDVYEYVQNQRALVAEAEDLYVESLERWRAANGIEQFDLVAHSLGGYLAVCYVLRYPGRVGRVVLASPGGVERTPFAVSNPDYARLGPHDRGTLRMPVSNRVDEYGFLGRYGLTGSVFRLLWRMRVSVFTFLRWLGPLGPSVLIGRNAAKLARSGNIQDSRELALFLRYVYSCCVRASFSETSIMRIFDATVVGKVPVLDKIRDMAPATAAHVCAKDFLWIYGEHDFMYRACGRAAIEELRRRAHAGPSTPGEYRFRTVANAGHNMYLDNDGAFDREVIDFLRY